MKSAFNVFRFLVQEIRKNAALHDYISTALKSPMEYDDLLRWQWAQSLSALDKLLHDLTRIGIMEIYSGKRPSTPKYESLEISIRVFSQMEMKKIEIAQWLERLIIQKHCFLSFQEPEKIADALSYIWPEKYKWQVIAQTMNREAHGLKNQLKNVVMRRNQIVHQGDIDFLNNTRNEIDKTDAIETVDLVDELGATIFGLVKL